MIQNCIGIVLAPFLAFLVQALIGKKLPRHGDFVSVAAIAISFALTIPIFMAMLSSGSVLEELRYTWISLHSANGKAYEIVIGVLINNLTVIMLFMVTLCALLIHLFSTGYMHGEERYHLFFAYISLFSAGMLGLVISNCLLTFFICWEIMGLCSYLLIGFYYKKPSAIAASIKAFMTTRVGDVGFFLGICGLYYVFGTSNFVEIYAKVGDPAFSEARIMGISAYTFIASMVLMGTVGKSAQFPLHIWLPDAMEGPTPVSALIHAATMVAAGVFLLIRMYPIFEAAHGVLTVVAYIGAITAFLAALLAFVQNDIKKVLAYSTISQLGYMVLGVGVGAFGAAFMHLITHACFKACLFLSSGSVIHSVHTQDMQKMGGLKSKMPLTFLAMFISTLAISGVPGFSGFVSKDKILAGVLAFSMEAGGHWLLPVLGFLVAGMTAFYMFRLIYLTFFGHARDEHKHEHAHEQPMVMVIPLLVLAGCSLAFWFAGPTGFESVDQIMPMHWFERSVEAAQQSMGLSLHHGNQEIHHHAHQLALVLSLVVAGLGIFLSTVFYLWKKLSAETVKNALEPMHRLLSNRYYFDDFVEKILIQKLFLNFNRALALFDDKVVDRIFVDGWRDVLMTVKSFVARFDDLVVDKLMVDGTGHAAALGGWFIRRFQTGKVQQYLMASVIFLALILSLVCKCK